MQTLGEHRQLLDEVTPRQTLQSTKDKDGTTTSDRAEECRKGVEGTLKIGPIEQADKEKSKELEC